MFTIRKKKKKKKKKKKHKNKKKHNDHDETRTRNLLIRSQTPYPLGHAADVAKGGSFNLLIVILIICVKRHALFLKCN